VRAYRFVKVWRDGTYEELYGCYGPEEEVGREEGEGGYSGGFWLKVRGVSEVEAFLGMWAGVKFVWWRWEMEVKGEK